MLDFNYNINIKKMKKVYIKIGCLFLLAVLSLGSCKKSILDEQPLGNLSSDVNFKTKVGFDNAITGLIYAARNEFTGEDLGRWYDMNLGTDIGTTGQEQTVNFRNYTTFLTPSAPAVSSYWNWAYSQMIVRANTIIEYASNPDYASVFASEEERNAYIAEARFFRAYAYNTLGNLYGGAVIVDKTYSSPKTDFTRSTREETWDFARVDAEFASQWLPTTVTSAREGHIVKAAADHLLTEIYNNLGQYDKAIASATSIINSGLYQLMTKRFGVNAAVPGDVYSDLFIEGNQNRTSGNMESIYVWQFENLVTGGGGNNSIRGWVPALWNLKDPAGATGMSIVDSLGRGVAYVRPTTFFLYDLWKGDSQNDLRNSKFNIRRSFYYNNIGSTYFNKLVERKATQEDTMRNVYPYLRKLEGRPYNGNNTSGGTGKDFIVYRLAETYLLRAEAYVQKGDLANAAADINIIRARSNAEPILSSQATIDYILDERARELITEERRRLTLSRLGKLVERVRKYQTRLDVISTIQDNHELYPIPQSAIDANFSAELNQNPGY
jgi:hypothetical protein